MRHPLPKFLRLSFAAIFCFNVAATAQLNASFTPDKSGGCSPLTVHFSNTSNASSSAVYHWDFGNGNTSTLKNPGAVFLDKKPYSVTLTVADGLQTSSTTTTVTVYKSPEVDFLSSLKQVCTPEPATFTAKATADNGSIANYMWDFGDGSTQRTYSAEVSHIYLTAQDPQVRLTVTDNHGCSNSKTINNLIKVFNGVHAAFDADKTFICFQPDPVTMINSSDGEGALSYAWDFGDGILSTEKNPTHSFNKKGIYTVKLTVKNDLGCTNTITKSEFLNVGTFKSDFSVPDIICKNSTVIIENKSTPVATSSVWTVDGTQTYYPDSYGYYFYAPGEHTIQLTNQFGGCEQTVTKKVDVKELPQPRGFIVDIPKYCFPPVSVNFRDTTTGAVKSEWNFNSYYPSSIQATGATVSNTFTLAGSWNVTLLVTDANGCKNRLSKPVTIIRPNVSVQTIDDNNITCESLKKKFKAYSNVQLTSFAWSFGDGATATDPEPQHIFSTGTYHVTLKYTTKDGCSGQTDPFDITVYPKPKADFTSPPGATICGNSNATFVQKLTGSEWNIWYVNQQNAGYSSALDYTFSDTGRYSITLIAANPGCSDTSSKTVTVVPSFPQITQVMNTCEGDRGTVTFAQASRYAEKWTWNFGDGTTVSFGSDQPQVTHHYTHTGAFNVTLTTANNACTNIASTPAVVLLKQHPVLSASKTDLCSDEHLNFSLTNLDVSSYTNAFISYTVQAFQYNDGATFPSDYYYWITRMPLSGTITNVQEGKDSVRLITNSFTGCTDTSNFIPIKIIGAIAGFQVLTDNVCFHSPFSFKDTSNAQNTTILSRQWDFGDGKTLTTTSGGMVYHTYDNPGNYYVSLTITDAAGCISTTNYVSHAVSVRGPKVDFSTYGNTFHLNTTVQFNNNTNSYNSFNTQYQWDFGDGTTGTGYYAYHTYTKPGNYKIKLIATNPDDGCSDSMQKTVTIKYFNANFSFTSSFLNNNDCSTTLVQFNNTSYDYIYVKWDFGDGFTADNVNYPSHVYTKPGSYTIKLFVTGNNGLSKTYTDTVIVKEHKVNISASINHTCTAQSVTMSAISGDASSYLWDFGDGTIMQATDSFSVHYYKTPGNYIPKLIAKDQNGCTASVELNNKISIDSLNVSLKKMAKICTPKQVQFNPEIVNIASDGGQQRLIYHWDFGTGNKADTANNETPSFMYQQPGNYTINVMVQSADGCTKEANVNILAQQGLGGQINGPSEICIQSAAQFTGSTLLPGQPKWQWIFDDGTIVNQQNPPAKEYNSAGNFIVKLVVDNNGCVDTVNKILQVHSNPVVNLSAKEETLCEGSSVSVSASGGNNYSWSPSAGLNNSTGPTVVASPVINTDYVVTITNTFGCASIASVKINVIHPFSLQMPSAVEVCSGNETHIQASGGFTYQWIDDTQGLDNIGIADPVAKPATTTIYTLVAHGENQCFSDTAQIKVTVRPAPVVNLGMDTTICEGQTLSLNAFNSSATYSWQDGSNAAGYLVKSAGLYFVIVNLYNCIASDTIRVKQTAIPYFTLGPDSSICSGEAYVLKPSLNTGASLLWQNGSTTPSFPVINEGIYTLTASNECGSHTDSVTITKGICNMLMPNAFTPNNDGLNDVFRVKYPFAVTAFHMMVVDRWGEKVFETNNIHEGWNGYRNGETSPAGIYVWTLSFIDTNNKPQQLKGTVTLLR